jgi:hypothetical protein
MKDISDSQLLLLVEEVDEDGILAGEDVRSRSISNVRRVMSRLGIQQYVCAGQGQHPLIPRIHYAMHQLYRPKDLAGGGLHVGAFLFRDIFARIEVRFAVGRVPVDPLKTTDLNELQIEMLVDRKHELSKYIDQFIDVYDFGWGSAEIGRSRQVGNDCRSLVGLSRFHSQAAAAVVTGAYDFRGAIQSALISVELILKAGLAANGLPDSEREKFKHRYSDLVRELSSFEVNLDRERIATAVLRLPKYVENRYSQQQPGKVETGIILMHAQYVLGEVIRQLTDRNFRQLIASPPLRVYPPLP